MGKKNINNAKRYTIAGGALFFAVAIIRSAVTMATTTLKTEPQTMTR